MGVCGRSDQIERVLGVCTYPRGRLLHGLLFLASFPPLIRMGMVVGVVSVGVERWDGIG